MESVTSDANDFAGEREKEKEKQPENKVPEVATPSIVWEKRPVSRKPRIILAASGSVAAIKFGVLADSLSDWAEVRAVATKPSLHFIDRKGLPASVKLYTDEDEWSSWSRIGDNVLHIELRKWADAMLIAPLSANTLAKVAGGLCDNLLTCIVRAWDFSKPMFVAPAMNTFMWTSPFTMRHLTALEDLGVTVIPPISKRLACGDTGNGAMAEPATIDSAMRIPARERWKRRRPLVSEDSPWPSFCGVRDHSETSPAEGGRSGSCVGRMIFFWRTIAFSGRRFTRRSSIRFL